MGRSLLPRLMETDGGRGDNRTGGWESKQMKVPEPWPRGDAVLFQVSSNGDDIRRGRICGFKLFNKGFLKHTPKLAIYPYLCNNSSWNSQAAGRGLFLPCAHLGRAPLTLQGIFRILLHYSLSMAFPPFPQKSSCISFNQQRFSTSTLLSFPLFLP